MVPLFWFSFFIDEIKCFLLQVHLESSYDHLEIIEKSFWLKFHRLRVRVSRTRQF